MSKKFLNVKQVGFGVGLVLAMPLLGTETGQAVPVVRAVHLPLDVPLVTRSMTDSELTDLQLGSASEEIPESGLPAGGAHAEPTTANFVSQPVLDAARRLSVSAVPALPGLGHAEKFLPAQDAFAPLRLVIKLSERRVYIYQKEQVTTSFPVAVGRSGWETPTGKYTVIQMQHDPVWQHPFTGELVPPGSDNPLGARWIGFWTDGTNYIGFHGTPNEDSVGQPASHGCVRMYNRDVIQLFEMVRLGTTVEVVP